MTQETLFLIFGCQGWYGTDEERAENAQRIEQTQKGLKDLGFELGEVVSNGSVGGTFIPVLTLPEGWTYQTDGRVALTSRDCHYNVIVQDANGHLRVCSDYQSGRDDAGGNAEICPRFRSHSPQLGEFDAEFNGLTKEQFDDSIAEVYDGELKSSKNGRIIFTQIPGAELSGYQQMSESEGSLKLCRETHRFVQAAMDKFLPNHKDPLAYWGKDCSAEIANLVKAFSDFRQNVFTPKRAKIIAAGTSGDPKPAS